MEKGFDVLPAMLEGSGRGAGSALGARLAWPLSGNAAITGLRCCSVACMVAFTWFWALRSAGTLPLGTAALLAAFVVGSATLGAWAGRRVLASSAWVPGIAFELVLGFFIGNTVLFAAVLISPFGIAADLGVIALLVAAAAVSVSKRPAPRRGIVPEQASLACIVLSGLIATLWVGDQQPVVRIVGDNAVYSAWTDIFIHAREISAFAQAHGFRTLSDIKLAGVPAAAYHFGSYMMPAALNALTPTSALQAFGAFQLPFGIVLAGLSIYSLIAVTMRTSWAAVAAAFAVFALPDAFQLGLGSRYLSFHFMSQVNLGMLYGMACIATAWLLMLEACRTTRWSGLALAYVFLAICVAYKAHLFVANSLLLLIYPCICFGSWSRGRRVVAVLVVSAAFFAVVAASQALPRVPYMRIDGSGIGSYVAQLMASLPAGAVRDMLQPLYFGHRTALVNAVLVVSLVGVGSFGVWLVAAPLALWFARRRIGGRVLLFVSMVFVNYLLMSTLLAMDRRTIGAPEEFVNRPHAWAYLVVVAFGTAALLVASGGRARRSQGHRKLALGSAFVAGVAALVFVARAAPGLQTFPEIKTAFGQYATFNTAPSCLVRSATYIRDHSSRSAVVQDAALDASMVVTAVTERQSHVIKGDFGGATEIVKERVAALNAARSTGTWQSLNDWAAARHVDWYLTHGAMIGPGNPGEPEDAAFRRRTVFRCGDFRVLRFTAAP